MESYKALKTHSGWFTSPGWLDQSLGADCYPFLFYISQHIMTNSYTGISMYRTDSHVTHKDICIIMNT